MGIASCCLFAYKFLKGDETMDFWKRAQELKDEIIQNRRRIHQNAEVGLNLPNTKAFVTEKLREYGLKPTECGHGVTATLGKPGKTLLLRADMDALPMPEESGEPVCLPHRRNGSCLRTRYAHGDAADGGENAERKRRRALRHGEIDVPARGRRHSKARAICWKTD